MVQLNNLLQSNFDGTGSTMVEIEVSEVHLKLLEDGSSGIRSRCFEVKVPNEPRPFLVWTSPDARATWVHPVHPIHGIQPDKVEVCLRQKIEAAVQDYAATAA
jgi:hypothetical protein